MATKSDLRYFIAEKIGDSLSSFTCLQSCTDGSLRIRTENVDDSLAVIEGICDLDGTLRYFQAYDLDDFGQGGSIFIVGGDEVHGPNNKAMVTLSKYLLCFFLAQTPLSRADFFKLLPSPIFLASYPLS